METFLALAGAALSELGGAITAFSGLDVWLASMNQIKDELLAWHTETTGGGGGGDGSVDVKRLLVLCLQLHLPRHGQRGRHVGDVRQNTALLRVLQLHLERDQEQLTD